MTVRSTRLFGPLLLDTTDPVILFTAPAAHTVIVKSLRIVNVGVVGALFDICIGPHDPGNALYWQSSINSKAIVADSVWWCLEDGESLIAVASAADLLTLTASGADLIGQN